MAEQRRSISETHPKGIRHHVRNFEAGIMEQAGGGVDRSAVADVRIEAGQPIELPKLDDGSLIHLVELPHMDGEVGYQQQPCLRLCHSEARSQHGGSVIEVVDPEVRYHHID